KILSNAAFGYWKVTVDRPLRLKVDLQASKLAKFRVACKGADEEPLANLIERVAKTLGEGPHSDFNAFMEGVEKDASEYNVKLTAKRLKLLQSILAERDEH